MHVDLGVRLAGGLLPQALDQAQRFVHETILSPSAPAVAGRTS